MIDTGRVTIVAEWASCLDGVCVVGSVDPDWKRFPENLGSRSTDEWESSSDSSDSVSDEVSESLSLSSWGSLNDSFPRFLPPQALATVYQFI